MKKLIEKIVSYIVSEEIDFQVNEEPSESENLTTYTILVPESEMGKIIGKEGKVIFAIRTLCYLKAVKEQKRIIVKAEPILATD